MCNLYLLVGSVCRHIRIYALTIRRTHPHIYIYMCLPNPHVQERQHEPPGPPSPINTVPKSPPNLPTCPIPVHPGAYSASCPQLATVMTNNGKFEQHETKHGAKAGRGSQNIARQSTATMPISTTYRPRRRGHVRNRREVSSTKHRIEQALAWVVPNPGGYQPTLLGIAQPP